MEKEVLTFTIGFRLQRHKANLLFSFAAGPSWTNTLPPVSLRIKPLLGSIARKATLSLFISFYGSLSLALWVDKDLFCVDPSTIVREEIKTQRIYSF